jgi:hypothetical protein
LGDPKGFGAFKKSLVKNAKAAEAQNGSNCLANPQGAPEQSIANPQQFLPLAKFILKAHAACDPEARDDAPLALAE